MNHFSRSNKIGLTVLLILSCFLFSCIFSKFVKEPQWPQVTKENKPWTRWWWMGNIVTPETLTETMEEYKRAGLGGLEITPIYGVRGYEDQFIEYLSPEFIDVLLHTLKEGKRLDMGIDIAGSSGWPFGGPWVTTEDACKNMMYKTYSVSGGERLTEKIQFIQEPMAHAIRRRFDISDIAEPVTANENLQALALTQVRYPVSLPLKALMGFSDSGEKIDLINRVDHNGNLNWTAPKGEWILYALFQGWHGKLVERAGPGGEGDVIDHFCAQAIDHYFSKFDEVFSGKDMSGLRAFFNDSYEVDDAAGQSDWTPEMFEQFERRRGYDLMEYLPALSGHDDEETNMRVLSDYRETISDLILEKFTHRWREWSNRNGFIIRNQAHGSPGNILDLYAASDIPETEGRNMQKIKFASSAANVTGKQYTSSESATLLNEHFISSLGDVKPVLDHLLLGGVNHIFYHGTTFSPMNEEWPGWLFYAAVHFDPVNSFWTDFAALNKYITRCQSLLQQGNPDNEILLYFPVYDRWAEERGRRGILQHIGGGAGGTGAGVNADTMLRRGFGFDFISDLQIKNLSVQKKLLHSGGNTYKVIVIPECKFIPLETFKNLIELVREGGTVIVHKTLPADIPGLGNLEAKRNQYKQLKEQLNFENIADSDIIVAKPGSGRVIMGPDLHCLLEFAGIVRESMTDSGLSFIRRKHDTGKTWFIVNRGNNEIDGWVPLQTEATAAAIFNPMTDEVGLAALRSSLNNKEIYLQLAPGESCLVQTFNKQIRGRPYRYVKATGYPLELHGKWKVEFIRGGPELPESVETVTLDSWTNFNSKGVKDFSGTAEYSISFSKPDGQYDGLILDLGEVRESAKVILNDKEMGTLIQSPFRIFIPLEFLAEDNKLKIQVSNLMANRIAYIERESYNWKKFYNANIPGRLPENRGPDGYFSAKHWLPRDSGLMGQVRITPVDYMKF